MGSELQEKVKCRDGWTCQKCGRASKNEGNVSLEAHHVVPESEGGADELDNLVTLCRQCHIAIPSPSPLIGDYRAVTEIYLSTDCPPMLDSFYFGSVDGERETFDSLSGQEKPESTQWVVSAALADYQDITRYLAEDFIQHLGSGEEVQEAFKLVRQHKSEDVQSGVQKARSEGKWLGSPPQGFKVNSNSRLEVKVEEFLLMSKALELVNGVVEHGKFPVQQEWRVKPFHQSTVIRNVVESTSNETLPLEE